MDTHIEKKQLENTKKMIHKHLHIILEKMCKSAGVKCDRDNFIKKELYLKIEWTERKQENFIKWLVKYLYENAEARKEIAKYPYNKSMRWCNKLASELMLNFGLKTK